MWWPFFTKCKDESLSLAKLARLSHATSDGSSEFIGAAITKPRTQLTHPNECSDRRMRIEFALKITVLRWAQSSVTESCDL